MTAGRVRPSPIAGSWYPGDAAAVRAEVDRYLADVPATSVVKGRLIGLIAPHAGLRYSGPVAAHAYSLLRGRSRLVAVLVGPSHRAAFAGVAAYDRGAFETPLGRAVIDEETAARLLEDGVVFADERPHRLEHSLEMQLPFLQSIVPEVRIVPLLMGSQVRAEVDALAGVLARVAGEKDVLLIASSDLSHYHPAPVANRLDAAVVTEVEALRPDGLMGLLERSHEHACGGGPMVAVMKAAVAAGARSARVLRYADSGDAGERDKSRVVGYMAAALLE